MRKLVVGILAHVDAGKTTLSEALLYQSGALRRLGRVDHQDAFLDTDALEKARGITIFSKQALLTAGDTDITLLERCSLWTGRSSPCWTRRVTRTFPARWSAPSRCWTAPSW